MGNKLLGIGEFGSSAELERLDAETKAKGASIKGFKEASEAVQSELDDVNRQMDEGIRIENKFRAAGYLPSQAHDLIKIMRNQRIGKIVDPTVPMEEQKRLFVLTPFNTVVDADVYVDTLQKQLLTLSGMVQGKHEAYTFKEVFKLLIGKIFKGRL